MNFTLPGVSLLRESFGEIIVVSDFLRRSGDSCVNYRSLSGVISGSIVLFAGESTSLDKSVVYNFIKFAFLVLLVPYL